MSNSSDYIHGSSPEEQRRLSLLNDILNESCLGELKLREGESVLDLGSGLGQFTRLMARTVGSTGQVVGIERDPEHQRADGGGRQPMREFKRSAAFRRRKHLSLAQWPVRTGQTRTGHSDNPTERYEDDGSRDGDEGHLEKEAIVGGGHGGLYPAHGFALGPKIDSL